MIAGTAGLTLAALLAQEAGIPFNGGVLATAGGVLTFFAFLMWRQMGRADKRVDQSVATVVAAAAAERDRAVESEARAWQRVDETQLATMNQQREFLQQLEAKNRRITELETENRLLYEQVRPHDPRTGPDGPRRR